MITIYHNPRCRKSREALNVLQEKDIEHKVRLYLEDPLNKAEIEALLKDLNMKAEDLIRKGEAIWKSDYRGKDLTEKQLVQAMIDHPKLMERPVLKSGNTAVVGRPIENVYSLLENNK